MPCCNFPNFKAKVSGSPVKKYDYRDTIYDSNSITGTTADAALKSNAKTPLHEKMVIRLFPGVQRFIRTMAHHGIAVVQASLSSSSSSHSTLTLSTLQTHQ